MVLRCGHLYGPGTLYAPDEQMARGVLAGTVGLSGDGEGTCSFLHVGGAASATAAAAEGWPAGVCNVVDDGPALAREWLPHYADVFGADEPPWASEEEVLRTAGWFALHRMAEMRGASNRRARGQGWEPAHPSWRDGLGSGVGHG